ncbi:MAG: type II toxin-antitoxin system mRNA interferase toxin, RelE/StbE family [Thermoanaerobaculia bacterium]|nr:type II toxin-antitoxin system mRNA interferase toxin, RelE/StbE family [Thermoanaerobaculia bacterium]
MFRVVLTRQVEKQLRRVPSYVVVKLQAWVEAVEQEGLEQVRKIPGFHDEPLHGPRQGQRSIRLSRLYRAIYEIDSEDNAEIARVEEVTKHEY